jgi:hypothetical protein
MVDVAKRTPQDSIATTSRQLLLTTEESLWLSQPASRQPRCGYGTPSIKVEGCVKDWLVAWPFPFFCDSPTRALPQRAVLANDFTMDSR